MPNSRRDRQRASCGAERPASNGRVRDATLPPARRRHEEYCAPGFWPAPAHGTAGRGHPAAGLGAGSRAIGESRGCRLVAAWQTLSVGPTSNLKLAKFWCGGRDPDDIVQGRPSPGSSGAVVRVAPQRRGALVSTSCSSSSTCWSAAGQATRLQRGSPVPASASRRPATAPAMV